MRASKYTNNKRDIEYIALYTFVTTYMLLRDLEYEGAITTVLDCMISTVGRDVRENGSRVTKNDRFTNFELFLSDREKRKLVTALNMLEPFSLQVLVLYHMEMLNTKEIGLLYDESVINTRLSVTKAEKELVEKFAALLPCNTALVLDDVCLWLNELDDFLGLEQTERVSISILSFLIEQEIDVNNKLGRFFWRHVFN